MIKRSEISQAQIIFQTRKMRKTIRSRQREKIFLLHCFCAQIFSIFFSRQKENVWYATERDVACDIVEMTAKEKNLLLFLKRCDSSFNCLFLSAISWWSAQWTVWRSNFLTDWREFLVESGAVFMLQYNWKRIQTWSLIPWSVENLLCDCRSFVALKQPVEWPEQELHTCVYLLWFLISYRQIYFRLFNSHILNDIFSCDFFFFVFEIIFYAKKCCKHWNWLFGGQKWKSSKAFEHKKIWINQLSLSYQQRRPFSKSCEREREYQKEWERKREKLQKSHLFYIVK